MSNIPPRSMIAETCEFPGCFKPSSHAILCKPHFNQVPAELGQALKMAYQNDDLAAYQAATEALRMYLVKLRSK